MYKRQIATWRDDLVGSRRRRRAICLVAACIVAVAYVASEISHIRFMRSELGSLIGATVMLMISLVFGVFCFTSRRERDLAPVFIEPVDTKEVALENIPLQHRELYQSLSEFIGSQGFTQSRLTLGRLAQQLDSKEHRLRSLINQSLGYRNFSSYLNDLRLPLACEWLQLKPELSITDIGLALGYGSITSFNRAFKSEYRVTPKEYRAEVLNNC